MPSPRQLIDKTFQLLASPILSPRNLRLAQFDLTRMQTRLRRSRRRNLTPPLSRLHLGCGQRTIPGWLNVDLRKSDEDVDLGQGRLPWVSNAFDVIVCQHVIEHLELDEQLIPLLKEINRVLKPTGQFWASCPDLSRICHAYVEGRTQDLLDERWTHWPDYSLQGKPISHLINDMFHQYGEHKQLFDLPLLQWTFGQAGLKDVREVSSEDLLSRFEGFPPRNDEQHAIYVCATKGSAQNQDLERESDQE